MKNLRGKMRSAHRVIDEALEVHNVGHIWALFSGGHDSMTSTHVTSLHPAFRGVVHIDTGTGIPETQQWEHKNGFRDKPAMSKKYCKWGHGRRVSDDQLALPGMDLQTLCTHCNSHAMDRQMLAVKKLKEIA